MNTKTTHTRTRIQGGYTILEIAIVAGLLSLLLGGLTSVFSASDSQVKANRVRIRAASEHRRNLDAVANILRDVDVRTLDNFDGNWTSANPLFARVTGASDSDRTYGTTLELRWRPKPEPVDGIAGAGAVYLVGPGGERLIADRVPQNGFAVRQDGSTLVIQLSTYYTTSDRRSVVLSGETAVTVRN